MNVAIRQRALYAIYMDVAVRADPRAGKAAVRDLAAAVAHAEAEVRNLVADPDAAFDATTFSRTAGSIVRAMRDLGISNDALPDSASFDGDCFLRRAGIDVASYLKLVGRTMDDGTPAADDDPPPRLDPDSPFGPKDDPELDAAMDADVAEAAEARRGTDDRREFRRRPVTRRPLPPEPKAETAPAQKAKPSAKTKPRGLLGTRR